LAIIHKKERMSEKQEITFHYIKSNNFSTHLATGGFGGLTVNGLINLNFFTDRAVIPLNQSFEQDELNNLNILRSEGKSGAVREIFCGIIMDLNTAKSISDWLQIQIQNIENSKK
jgi:hypothetical protein